MSTAEQNSLLERLDAYEQVEPAMDVTSPPPTAKPLADGYVRQTPVQTLRTGEGYQKNIRRKIIRLAIGAVFLALVIAAIFRSGIIHI